MSAIAYYNDSDKFVCQWLRELIKAGLIAPGEVDERSIEEVKPEDLRGFTQCHFFAGIGVWSYALRLAGVPDDRPIWTGSCPCPPFSSVGLKKACPQCEGTNPVPHVGRTGFFVCCLCDHEWLADSRHLWPELWRLISVGRPDTFFGEQVASDDGRTWLASVRASLEILGYAVGAADLCSAGVGSADIRQRLFFVADSMRTGRAEGWAIAGRGSTSSGSVLGVVGESNRTGSQPGNEGCASVGHRSSVIAASSAGELVNTERRRWHGREDLANTRSGRNRHEFEGTSREPVGTVGEPESNGRIGRENNGDERRRERAPGQAGEIIKLVHTNSVESGNGELQRGRRLLQPSENPLTGFWRDAEWIYCRDEKWRPVEPGTFPLVTGTPNRVGRLRGYGNAINAEAAKAFIEAYMSI